MNLIPVRNMIEPGKAIDPRARALDGKSLAPEPQRGHTPCNGGALGHTLLCPHEWLRFAPKGYVSPFGVTSRYCEHNDLIRRHSIWARALLNATDKDCPDVDAIDSITERLMSINAQLMRSTIAHEGARAHAEKQQLHEQNSRNARSKQGPWEFTLTYSPTTHGWTADEAKDAMRVAIERLTRYYRDEIEQFHAVGEYTQLGAPHVHAWYKLDGGRKMTSKSFKRAYPIWNERHKLGRGHEGGHHEPVKRTSDFAGYVEKHLDTAWLQIDITNVDPTEEAHVPEAEEHDEASPSASDASDASTEPDDR